MFIPAKTSHYPFSLSLPFYPHVCTHKIDLIFLIAFTISEIIALRDSKIRPELRNYSKFEDELKAIKNPLLFEKKKLDVKSDTSNLFSKGEEIDDLDTLDKEVENQQMLQSNYNSTSFSVNKVETVVDSQTSLPDLDVAKKESKSNETNKMKDITISNENNGNIINKFNAFTTFHSIADKNEKQTDSSISDTSITDSTFTTLTPSVNQTDTIPDFNETSKDNLTSTSKLDHKSCYTLKELETMVRVELV